MSEPVPWRIGESVPWSVAWTAEKAFRLQKSTDFPGQWEVAQLEKPGEGEPVFAGVHVTRHRRGMVGFLCHVCGKPTPVTDRYIFPVVSGGLVTLQDGSQLYGGNVPPVHAACAEKAGRLCPHLRRAFAEPVACPDEPSRLIPRTDVPPGMEFLAKTYPAGPPVIYACYRLYGPKFTRRVRTLRDAHVAAGRPLLE
jgi:hypothetical protein